jgi:hypothetical protein
MPLLTRGYIKSSLVCFIAALLAGMALVLRPYIHMPEWTGALGPVYFHLFMVGWVTQLIFGIVFWMFPKYSIEKPRGSEGLGWATFWLLNAGLLLRVIGEPANTLAPGGLWGWLVALSAALQWLAGMAFVVNTWERVKEK